MLSKDAAICIRALDYSETSQIVTFFTRATGKIDAIAKGSKRPKSSFDGPIEVFAQGGIVFSDSSREKLATLTEFQQKPVSLGFRKNLFALNCAYFAAELLNGLTHEHDRHSELFDSFEQFLENLSQAKEQKTILTFMILFQLSLLKEIGLQPILNACVNCKNDFRTDWQQCYFSNSANGLICRDCEASFSDKITLSRQASDCLSNLKMLADAKEETLYEVEKILVFHFTELLHRRPKMAKYVLKQ
jgi:DNA repair protein RecO (recombination protein O)